MFEMWSVSVVTPVKQLKAFSKPFLQPGEMQTVVLKLPIQELALYDLSMKKSSRRRGV